MATVRITWAAFALATVLPLPALDRPSSQQEKSLRDLLPVADLREPTELYDWVAYCPENFNFSFDLQRAQAGDLVAKYVVGLLYFNGCGVRANRSTGIQWLQPVSKAGNIDAEAALGALYEVGVVFQ